MPSIAKSTPRVQRWRQDPENKKRENQANNERRKAKRRAHITRGMRARARDAENRMLLRNTDHIVLPIVCDSPVFFPDNNEDQLLDPWFDPRTNSDYGNQPMSAMSGFGLATLKESVGWTPIDPLKMITPFE